MSRVMLFAVVSLACAPAARADDAEDKAAALVTKLKGVIVRDDKKGDKPVIGVHLGNTKVTDAELKELAGFKSLAHLVLNNTAVTDAGVKELAALKGLSSLDLAYTKVTDAGVKELAALKTLTEIDLS